MDAKAALTLLTRLGSRKPEQATRLDQFFQGRLEELAEAALEVAIETGDPIGSRLPRQIEAVASPELAERLVQRFDDVRYDDSLPAPASPRGSRSLDGEGRREGQRALRSAPSLRRTGRCGLRKAG